MNPTEPNSPADGAIALRVRDIVKSFGPQRILDGVSLDIERGKVVCILGPSGSGKSTLLRCLNWLTPPDAGEVWIGDERVGMREGPHQRLQPRPAREIRAQRSRIGMVFQNFNLWPHMSVIDNVMEGLISVKGIPRLEASDIAAEALRKVGLAGKHTAMPAALSGGQQQRVGIARMLAMAPEVILFDEPTSALDPELVGEVLLVLEEMAREGMTMLLVTHEMSFARRVAHRVVFMHQGKVWEQAPAKEFFAEPKTVELKSFLSAVLH